MEDYSFKTSLVGGYDKKSVYAYMDMMNVRLHKLEILKKEGSSADEAYEIGPMKYPEEVLKKASVGGFNEKQVDEFINKITNQIKDLERELNIR